MKRLLMLTAVLLLGLGSAQAQVMTEADLTPEAVSTAVRAMPAAERVAYARKVLLSAAAYPADEAAKTQRLVSAARGLIAGAGQGQAVAMIAEIYTATPIENLPALAELMATNGFGQAENKFTDAQYDAFAKSVIKTGADYIAKSGADAPDVRIASLVNTFKQGSSDAERTGAAAMAVLPAGYANAVEQYNRANEAGARDSYIAERAGVTSVAATPADPDLDNVVVRTETAQADTSYLSETSPDVVEPPAANETEPAPVGTRVPLLSRYVTDVLGASLDAAAAAEMAFYDWETLPPTLPGQAAMTQPGEVLSVGIDGQIPASFPKPKPMMPSPTYRNQFIRGLW